MSSQPFANMGDEEAFNPYTESKKSDSFTSKHKHAIWLFVVLVIGAVVMAIAYVATKEDEDHSTLPPISFNDAFNSTFSPRYSSVYWMNGDDSNSYTAVEGSDIVKYTLPGFTRTVIASGADIIDPSTGQPLSYYNYYPSADAQRLLFQTQHQPLYRYSSYDVYLVFNTVTKNMSYLANGAVLRYALWAPTGHKIAYVQDLNVYVWDDDARTTFQLTNDGLDNSVINGVCDWAYEEEVFGGTGAIYWAPDAQNLAFLRFQETEVPQYQFTYPYDVPYNTEYMYKYPKSGANNSVVTLGLYNVQNDNVTFPEIGATANPDQYVIELAYWSPTVLALKTMPRLQNSYQVFAMSTATDATRGVLTPLSNETHPQYLEPHSAMNYFPSSNQYVDIIVYQGWDHIALMDASTGQTVRMLTQGTDWGVFEIDSVDTVRGVVYYLSNEIQGTGTEVEGGDVGKPLCRRFDRTEPVLPLR